MAQKYRKIDPRIWRDEKFRRLTAVQKLVAVYCLTAQANRCGIFAFSTAAAAQELGLTQRVFDAEFAIVTEAMAWRWDADAWVLYLPRWWKYNAPESGKTMRGCLSDLADLPTTPLLAEFAANDRHLTGAVSDTFRAQFATVSDTNQHRIGYEAASYGISGAGAGAGAGAGVPNARSPEADEALSEFDPDDPLKSREAMRKAFESAWNAAGLMPLDRLNRSLWTKLEGLMLDPDWRKIWRDALARAGKCPVLATGAGGKRGPMDPRQFLGDVDFAHAILRGMFDPREPSKPAAATNGKTFSTDPFRELIEAELAAQQGAAS